MTRSQFTFYNSFWESIETLRTNKEKLQAYQLICRYALYGGEPELESVNPGAATVFRMARPILDTARRRAEAGKKGGLASANCPDWLKPVGNQE